MVFILKVFLFVLAAMRFELRASHLFTAWAIPPALSFFFHCWWSNLGPVPSALTLSTISLAGFFGVFFPLRYWGLNSGPVPWASPPVLLCDGFFQNRILQIICPGWLWTVILLISASWVARITDVNQWHLACNIFLVVLGFESGPHAY
jgi:hypothetical protein